MKIKLATRSDSRHDRNADVHWLSSAKRRAIAPVLVLLILAMALLVPPSSRKVMSADLFRLPFRLTKAKTEQPKPNRAKKESPPSDENGKRRFRLPALHNFLHSNSAS